MSLLSTVLFAKLVKPKKINRRRMVSEYTFVATLVSNLALMTFLVFKYIFTTAYSIVCIKKVHPIEVVELNTNIISFEDRYRLKQAK